MQALSELEGKADVGAGHAAGDARELCAGEAAKAIAIVGSGQLADLAGLGWRRPTVAAGRPQDAEDEREEYCMAHVEFFAVQFPAALTIGDEFSARSQE